MEIKLGELIVNFDSKRRPLSKMIREQMKGPYPYYGAASIFDYINDYIFDGEYILLGEDGTVLEANGTPILQLTKGKFWANNHTHVLKNNEKLVDFKYLYYLLKNTVFSEIVTGAVQQKISQGQMNSLLVDYNPDKKTQMKIASFLSSIDDKIDLNNKMNINLEQQAVLIFNQLFLEGELKIDNEFGEISNSIIKRKIGSLDILITDFVANGSFASLKENVKLYNSKEYAYFIRNTDLKSGVFEVFVDKHSYDFLSKSTLFGGEIIISNVGDVGSVFLCPTLDGPMTLGNNIIMLRPVNDNLRYYLYIWFKHSFGKNLIKGITGGSAQPKFNKTDFRATSVLLPIDTDLFAFDENVSPLFERIILNQEENKKLAELRNVLLPRLMSGKIDLEGIEI